MMKAYEITLNLTSDSAHAPSLFSFMLNIMNNINTVDKYTPAPKSTAEIILHTAYINTGDFDDLETGLYETSLQARNGLNRESEKYCLDVIKEMRKILRKRQS
jgi:hypothetical protein|tara:strand:+ start:847 stop:1155 length:309 start_codon:yes stop_codon:yes gene_type:complete